MNKRFICNKTDWIHTRIMTYLLESEKIPLFMEWINKRRNCILDKSQAFVTTALYQHICLCSLTKMNPTNDMMHIPAIFCTVYIRFSL